jgi:hypothetical protein
MYMEVRPYICRYAEIEGVKMLTLGSLCFVGFINSIAVFVAGVRRQRLALSTRPN